MPKSNSAFYLLKEADPDNWENFKAWNILKSTPKFLEPQGDASETMEEEDEEDDAASPPNKVNVEDQPSTTDASVENLNTRLLLISCSQGILSSSSFSCYPLLRLFVYMYLSQLMRTFTNYLKCIVISS